MLHCHAACAMMSARGEFRAIYCRQALLPPVREAAAAEMITHTPPMICRFRQPPLLLFYADAAARMRAAMLLSARHFHGHCLLIFMPLLLMPRHDARCRRQPCHYTMFIERCHNANNTRHHTRHHMPPHAMAAPRYAEAPRATARH